MNHTIEELKPIKVGDRFLVFGHWDTFKGDRKYYPYDGFVLQVAQIVERGLVCDLIRNGFNLGHRMLYEWKAEYDTEKQ